MTDNENTVHPSLGDLGEYLKGLGAIQLERDRVHFAHLASENEANRVMQLRQEEARAQERERVLALEAAQRQDTMARRELVQREAEDAAARDRADKELAVRAEASGKIEQLKSKYAEALAWSTDVAANLETILTIDAVQANYNLIHNLTVCLNALKSVHGAVLSSQREGRWTPECDQLLPKTIDGCQSAMHDVPRALSSIPRYGVGRFVKVALSGERLSPFAPVWSAVIDLRQNLMWLCESYRCTNIDDFSPKDLSTLLKEKNALSTCGANDWRLPTADEFARSYFPEVTANYSRSEWCLSRTDSWFWTSRRGEKSDRVFCATTRKQEWFSDQMELSAVLVRSIN